MLRGLKHNWNQVSTNEYGSGDSFTAFSKLYWMYLCYLPERTHETLPGDAIKRTISKIICTPQAATSATEEEGNKLPRVFR